MTVDLVTYDDLSVLGLDSQRSRKSLRRLCRAVFRQQRFAQVMMRQAVLRVAPAAGGSYGYGA